MLKYLKQKYGIYKKKKAFWKEYEILNEQKNNTNERLLMSRVEIMPCYWDKTNYTSYDHHYVLHTAWAVRKVLEINPDKHIDISSSLYFCANLSSFLPVEFYDYRHADLFLSNLKTAQADLTKLNFKTNSINSISCMHTIEHIGLGRFGDPLDYDGDIKAISELKRVTAKEGNLLFVVPVGKSKIIFNAHRIYSYKQILSYFDDWKLIEFSLITDDDKGGKLIINATEKIANEQKYGCGCFWFKKE